MEGGVSMELRERHYNAIELMIDHPKATTKQIAEELGLSPKTISAWKKDPDFQIEYQLQLKQKWKDGEGIAVDAMLKLAQEGSFQAAKFILECNGYAAVAKDDQGMSNVINIILGD